MKRTLRRNSSGPWAAIDAARFAWDAGRRALDDKIVALGVRRRFRDGANPPLVTVDEHGLLVVDLGVGVKITGRDAAGLLAAVAGGLLRLAAERRARVQRRKAVLAARAAKTGRLERLKVELAAGGAR